MTSSRVGTPGTSDLREGLVAVVKADCPTCHLVEPALEQLSRASDDHLPFTVISQDDPAFPTRPTPIYDADLDLSARLDVEVVPTLLRFENGSEVGRAIGWHRQQWQELAGVVDLAPGLPESRPGCGSLHLDPRHTALRATRDLATHSRLIELGEAEDEIEACFERGWSDGLPVVPPTPARLARMLLGTTRSPEEVVARVAPDFADCTVEKIAINAVMAGCRPEYLPVVIAAVQAACSEEFNWHGLAATTYIAGPVVIVNGPIARALGMNSGMNALGQGNRANATIGRALQLVLRNVGGARPGEIDRATLGHPGKYTFCFAENEEDSPWESLASERGIAEGASAVTLFAGEAPRGVVDQLSRTPESLSRSLAMALRSVAHPKLAFAFDAIVVITPEHARVFEEAGWTKDRLRSELMSELTISGSEMVRGALGCAEGLPEEMAEATIPKFRPDGILFVHAGGRAGLFSAVIGGWINGATGSQPVTHEVLT